MKNKIGIFTLFLCSGLMLFESLNILTSAAPPTTDQFLFQQKPASGPFNQYGVTPVTGQAFGWNGSTVVMLPTSGGSFQPLNSTLTAISANSGAVDISGTTLTLPTSFITAMGTQTLTNKTINGANNTLTVRLANDVTGNLGVSHLNSGTSASSSTFWRGDGTWATAGSNYDPANVAITGGTITGTPISGSTGSFTTLASDGSFTLTGSTFGGFGGVSFVSSQLNLGAYTSINFSNLQTGENMSFSGGALTLSNAAKLGWGDVSLSRAAANTLALRKDSEDQTLVLGPATTNGVMLKQSGGALSIRLGDDSGLATVNADAVSARVLTGSAVTVLPVSLAANNTIWSDGVHLYWRDDSGSDHQLDNP